MIHFSLQMIKENGGLIKLVAFISDTQPPEEEEKSKGGKGDKGKASRAGKKGKDDGESALTLHFNVYQCTNIHITRAANHKNVFPYSDKPISLFLYIFPLMHHRGMPLTWILCRILGKYLTC